MSQQPSFGVNYAHGVRQRTPPGPHGLSGVSSSPSSSQQQQLQAISPMYRGHQTPTPSKMGPGPLQGPRHPQPFPPAGYGPQTSSPGFQHEQYGAQPRLQRVDSSPQGYSHQMSHPAMSSQVPKVGQQNLFGEDGAQQPGSFQRGEYQQMHIRHPANIRPERFGPMPPGMMPAPNQQNVRFAGPHARVMQPGMRPAFEYRAQMVGRPDAQPSTPYRVPQPPEGQFKQQQPAGPALNSYGGPQQGSPALRAALSYESSPQSVHVVSQHGQQQIMQPIRTMHGYPVYGRKHSVDEMSAEAAQDGDEEDSIPSPKKAKPAGAKPGKTTPVRPGQKAKPGKKERHTPLPRDAEAGLSLSSSLRRRHALVTDELLRDLAGAVDPQMVLEENVKAGIVLHTERFIDDLVREVAAAAALRRSKQVRGKDVDFVLQKLGLAVHGPKLGLPKGAEARGPAKK